MVRWNKCVARLFTKRDSWSVSKCHEEKVPNVSVSEMQFQSSTFHEQLFAVLGVLSAIVMGVLFPLMIAAYTEMMNMMIVRQTVDSNIPPTIFLPLFGGGDTNSSGSLLDQMDRLVEDSVAYLCVGLLINCLQFTFAAVSIYCLNYSALKRVGRIRRYFLKAVLYQEIAWHDTQNTGAFASDITDSLDKIHEGTGEKVGMFTYLVTTFVASVVISFFYGWELTLVMAAICPFVILSTFLVAKLQTALTVKEGHSYGAAGSVVEEVLSNIRTVVAYGGEQKEVQRYRDKLAAAERVGVQSGMCAGGGGGVTWMLTFFAYSLAFWYGTPLILRDRKDPNGHYTPGILLIVMFGVVVGAMNMGFCIPHFEAFARARGAAKSVLPILKRRPAIDTTLGGTRLYDTKLGDIEFRDVHFSYPARSDVQILKGLSLKIRKGENVALVGGSGSGKSTIIQMIQRFYDPLAGSVTLNGVDLKELDLKWVRSQIGLVGQEPVLFNVTIAENICCDLRVTRAEMEQAAKDANAHDFITKLPMGYSTMVGERGTQLSGGQKQRIALARALIRKPTILLLDEATSALDMTNEAIVQTALERASQGRTTVTVSHRLSSIRNVDRILVMSGGKVVEDGTHEELVALQGHYHSLITADASLNESQTNQAVPESKAPEKNGHLTQEETNSLDEYIEKKQETKEEVSKAPLRRIIGLNRPDWAYVLAGSISSFLNGCISPASAVFFGNMFWALSNPVDSEVLASSNGYALIFLFIGIAALICVFIQISTLTVAGVRMTGRLRVMVFKAMLGQEMAWFDDQKHSVGSLCAQLSGDTSNVQAATGSKLGSLLQGISCLGVGTALSFFYSWKMTLVCLVCVPVIFLSVIIEGRVFNTEGAVEKQALEDATKVAVEAISAVRTVHSLGQEEAMVTRYTRKLAIAERALRRKTRFRGLVFGFGQTVVGLAYTVSIAFGGWLIARQGEEYKNIVIVSEALLFGAWMLGQVLGFVPNMQIAKIAAGRLFTILDRKPQIYSPKENNKSSSWEAVGDIQYEDVHFAYPTRSHVQVLQGLRLTIPQGKKVALVGPSGCGKSTCIQLLQRFYDPLSGTIKIDTQDTGEIPIGRLRAELGIVSQEPVLFDKTIAENIAYGDNSRIVPTAEIVEAAKRANVHSFITALPAGYETRLGSKGTQLSGGQKQRIAIARALVRNPRIMILDEATSALDSQSEKLVQEALDEASEGRTCIIIAHRLSTVTNADVICVLQRGRVVEAGSHAQLVARGGHYTQLLKSQQTGAH